jgi:nucleoside-diphosphate-sugar epimerase/2-polyprenyl-3-methyl-5-hydroxy-6-metoxy-1,4-benzoquinol methylase
MRYLITGGTGFIGSRLALRLRADGHEVRVLGQVNNEAEAANRREIEATGAEVVLAGVTEPERVAEALEGVDVVFHLAAAQHEANVGDEHFREVNVAGTETLAEACVKAGVKRLVHGSTIGVYGENLKGTVDGSTPERPDNIYGRTKLEGEGRALAFGDRLPVAVVRIPETYGPGDRRLLKLFKGVQKGFFPVIGPGDNPHHLIYVDDLIDALLLAATADGAVGRVCLVAGREPLTTRQMVDEAARAVGVRLPNVRLPLWPFMAAAGVMEATLKPMGIQPPIHRRRMDFFRKGFTLSTEPAREVLGFAPKWGFAEGAAETVRWYRDQGLLPPVGGHGAGRDPALAARARERRAKWARKRSKPYDTVAILEPFDSFWEAPDNVEKGYTSFYRFYAYNYLSRVPPDRDAKVLVISCGPGYFVDLLARNGYTDVLGIDSFPDKVAHAERHGLNCRVERAFPFLDRSEDRYDAIFCEQELNHLRKDEITVFLDLCWARLKEGGTLIVHGLNGANPIVGSESMAQNIDHYNTFTEYSIRQVLEHADFEDIRVFPLTLYVFFKNPVNYALMAMSALYTAFFRISFMMYGKKNRIFTKKIAASCRKPREAAGG